MKNRKIILIVILSVAVLVAAMLILIISHGDEGSVLIPWWAVLYPVGY